MWVNQGTKGGKLYEGAAREGKGAELNFPIDANLERVGTV